MTNQRNEGEGNKTAARRFNKKERAFVKSGKVEKAAEEAKRAVQSSEAESLKQAEREGLKKARH
jgi:hypothetical protein